MKTADQLRKLSGPFLACRGQTRRWTSSTINHENFFLYIIDFIYLQKYMSLDNVFFMIIFWFQKKVNKNTFNGFKKYPTVANFLMYSSGAPKLASPISCENWANAGSANRGTCPNSSWQTSLEMTNHCIKIDQIYFTYNPVYYWLSLHTYIIVTF